MLKSTACILCLLWLSSCKEQPKTIYSRISQDFWTQQHPEGERDSLLLIAKYGLKTKGYTRYWVQLVGRPYEVSRDLKTVHRYIDNRTIYRDLNEEGFSDYKKLLRKGMIRLKEPSSLDDRFEGFIYLVKNGTTDPFVAVPIQEYFPGLSETERKREPRSDEEQALLFDEVADDFFHKRDTVSTDLP